MFIVLVAACAQLQTIAGRVSTAAITMSGPLGEVHGGGEVWQANDGRVHVSLRLQGLPPGVHGIHFHAAGNCDSSPTPTFGSAGGHFNPMARRHGLNNPSGPHAGDAPNFTVGPNGIGTVDFITERVTLSEGPLGLFDADGSSLVVHAGADDQLSDPAGNSGARIACGVVKKVL